MFCNTKRVKKEINAAMTGRITQPKAILPATPHFTSFPPFRIPMPMIAPTMAWELDTGTRGIEGRFMEFKKLLIPWEAKTNNTIEWEMTTIKAATGDNRSRSLPTVNMTFLEYVITPTE